MSEKEEPEDELNQKETIDKQSLSEFLINLKEKIKEDELETKTVMLKDLIDIGSFSGKYNFMKVFMMNPVKSVVENLYARIMS